MKWLRLMLFAFVLCAAGASAGDEEGRFAMKGAGFLPCEVFVAEREKRSNTYYLIGGWIEGYITAYNKHAAETYDITPFESLELLFLVMQNHCEANPRDRLYSVLNSILIKLAPDRLLRQSDRIKITEGKRTTVLYSETIGRIQAELTRRGLYKGAIDGRFTDETRSALIAFQTDIGFESTGFPDQTTLWRLLRK